MTSDSCFSWTKLPLAATLLLDHFPSRDTNLVTDVCIHMAKKTEQSSTCSLPGACTADVALWVSARDVSQLYLSSTSHECVFGLGDNEVLSPSHKSHTSRREQFLFRHRSSILITQITGWPGSKTETSPNLSVPSKIKHRAKTATQLMRALSPELK